MSTFVSVGNARQPFTRLLDGVVAIANGLPQPVVVQHGHTPFSDPRCVGKAFYEMPRFEDEIVRAGLVIMQAGGGGVLLAIRCGKVPIVVPRRQALSEVIDDHQVSWATALDSTGRAVLVEDLLALESGVREALHRQAQRPAEPRVPQMIDMVRAALHAGNSDARPSEKRN